MTEDKKQKNSLAKMGTKEQIKQSHIVRKKNFITMGRKTMTLKERNEWRKKIKKKQKKVKKFLTF